MDINRLIMQRQDLEGKIIDIMKKQFPYHYESLKGNDCAHYIKEKEDSHLLITKDLLVEHTHFYPNISMKALAYKSLIVNMSDILSDGGEPKAFVLGLGVPKNGDKKILELVEQLCYWAKYFNVPIIGGDTVLSQQLFISVTCLGETQKKPWYRSRAQVGDHIYVTGKLGDSAKGFLSIQKDLSGYSESDPFIKRHLFPPYRLPEIQFLQNYYGDHIRAATDISDGFILDCSNILLESNVGAHLFLENLVGSDFYDKKAVIDTLSSAEEYEIILTSSSPIENSKDMALRCIGHITNKKGEMNFSFKKDPVDLEIADFFQLFRHFPK